MPDYGDMLHFLEPKALSHSESTCYCAITILDIMIYCGNLCMGKKT